MSTTQSFRYGRCRAADQRLLWESPPHHCRTSDAEQIWFALHATHEDLTAADHANTQAQRDLIISSVKLAEAGSSPIDNYCRALGIAERLESEQRLNQADGWMVEELRRRLLGLLPISWTQG